jgi:hypothetical protein
MPNGHLRELKTFDSVVKALGGKREVARICGIVTGDAVNRQDTTAVCNWKRRRGKFPTKYYPVMIEELEARGATAPHTLWGFYKKKN